MKGNQKLVAIKVIEYDEEDDEDIHLEVEILQMSSHPNIVGYFGTYAKLGKVWVSAVFFFLINLFPFWEKDNFLFGKREWELSRLFLLFPGRPRAAIKMVVFSHL